MTNREKAQGLATFGLRGYANQVRKIESALNDERKAGELDGQIKALEWASWFLPSEQPSKIKSKLGRLRAEKAKLG